MMITGAVLAALLFMSIGACSALGVARRFAGGGLRGGYGMTAPGGMRGFDGRGQGGFGRGGDRGFGPGRGFDRGQGRTPGQLPSQDTTATY